MRTVPARYEFIGGPFDTERITVAKIDGELPVELHAGPSASFTVPDNRDPDYEDMVIQVPLYQRLSTEPTIWSDRGHYVLRPNGYNPLLSTYEWVSA